MATSLTARELLASQIGLSHDDTRDINEIFGWDKNLSFSFFNELAKETAIGARCVFTIPKQCWSNGFNIEDYEPFDKKFKRSLCNAAMRADQLNRIYKFSILYIGVPDGKDPDQPLGTARKGDFDGVYFQPYAYDGIEFEPETDTESPRLGLPKYYNLQIRSRGETQKDVQTKTLRVHHSRVVHIAETLTDSNVEGMPYLKPIYKYILNLDKTTGGSAEAYFRNARGKYSFEIAPEFATELLSDSGGEVKTAIDENAKDFTNKWQDYMLASGIQVKQHQVAHASPKDTEEASWKMIYAYTGMPKRVFTGEGGGQYAGAEDKLTMNAIIDDRQNTHCLPIIERILEVLTQVGIIDYKDQEITFPLESPLSIMEEAEIADKRAGAVEKVARALSQPTMGNLSEDAIIKVIEQVTGIEIGPNAAEDLL